jgi:hypothetical protein
MIRRVLEGSSWHLRTVPKINSFESGLLGGDWTVAVGHQYS